MPTDSGAALVPARWLPHPAAIHGVVLAVLLFAAFLAKGPWDSDFYWHLRTGQFLAEGQYLRTDPYSFTWGGQPWVLHEWLGELLLYLLVDGIGYMGAVLVYALVPGIACGILVLALHRLGVCTPAVAIATTMSALLIIPYATIRPQALSWIMFALLIAGLLHVRPDRSRWLLLLAPMFALWANLHGLWAVGLAVLGAYTGMSLLGWTPMSRSRAWALAMVPLAMLGAIATPEGPSLLLYPLRYVDAGDWGMANITEWQSPDFHDPAHLPFLLFIVGLAVFGRRRVPWWMSVLAIMGVAMTLLALRNGAVAAILGAPALALGIDAAMRDWRPDPRPHPARLARARRLMELGIAAVIAIAGIVVFVPRDPAAAVRASIERELPVQGVALLQDRVPSGRILADYGWGGYVIGEMYDLGARVMVDGRNDMYDDAILAEYGAVRDADPGWEAIVDRYAVDAMVFPPYRAITKGAAERAGWCEILRDENEVVYLRDCGQ